MKSLLLSVVILLSAAIPAGAKPAWLALSPIPYGLVLPDEIVAHLSTGPILGPWAEQVAAAGARSAVTVYYRPAQGEKTILLSAYYFDADKWDAAQRPDEPPPFGEPVFRGGGRVLAVAGPHDTIFDPGSEDGRLIARAAELIGEPASFQPVE